MSKSLVLFLSVGAVANSAFAADVTLHLGGTEFRGGPAFELLIDQEVVGQGTVEPVPTPGKYAKFTFHVPDEVLAKANQISVRMTNDAYQKGIGDRNLVVGSITVESSQFEGHDFRVFRAGEDLKRSDGHLNTNSDVAVVEPPSFGWFKAPHSEESAPPSLAESRVCETLTVAVMGYPNGHIAIDEEQRTVLSPIIQQGGCRYSVIGYSSILGPERVNKQLAYERAKVVAEYLSSKGVQRERIFVTGKGETSQFGSTHNENRRVMVSTEPL